MSDFNVLIPPDDEALVAYLDGQLDADEQAMIEAAIEADEHVAERFDFLCRSNLPYQAAFDTLLDEAPLPQLQAMLDNLAAPAPAPAPAPVAAAPSIQTTRQGMGRRGFLAMAASFVVAGVVADRLFTTWSTPPAQPPGWRAMVAEYMALYTPQTLDNLNDDRASHDAQLASISARLGLKLDSDVVNLEHPELKRAQILEYSGEPIAQITYLDPQHGPLALCITNMSKGVKPPVSERQQGMNVVFWSSASHTFMLIGHNPPTEMDSMAKALRERLSA